MGLSEKVALKPQQFSPQFYLRIHYTKCPSCKWIAILMLIKKKKKKKKKRKKKISIARYRSYTYSVVFFQEAAFSYCIKYG